MPFIVGEGDPVWDNQPEDADYLFKVADFHYVENIAYPARPDGPVRFSLELPAPVPSRDPGPVPAAALPVAKPSLLDRLLGRTAKTPPANTPPAPDPLDYTKHREAREKQYQDDSRRFLAAVTQAMRAAGVKAASGRYNGGNDEGFSDFGHYLGQSGTVMPLDDVTARLAKTDLRARLTAFNPDRKFGRDAAEIGAEIAEVCSVLLLGSGYGTGAFLMYGGFTVDFEACTITDDPAAEPGPEAYGVER